jgi:hypothetical protein
MKTQLRALTAAIGLGMVLASGSAMAESTYGYNDQNSNNVYATAHLKITVKIPKLILLRVGTGDATVDELIFSATATITSIVPTAGTNASALAGDWNGTAPTIGVAVPASTVGAYTWNNSSGGGNLVCAVTSPFTRLAASNVTVSAAGSLAHPGAHTGCGDTVTLARNTLLIGAWTYTLDNTAVAAAAAGSDSEIITYTASTL